jgi:hypothetical protein
MSLSYYDDVLLIPAAKARKRDELPEYLGELEFGEECRSPRVLAGWWIVPALMAYAAAGVVIYFAA